MWDLADQQQVWEPPALVAPDYKVAWDVAAKGMTAMAGPVWEWGNPALWDPDAPAPAQESQVDKLPAFRISYLS